MTSFRIPILLAILVLGVFACIPESLRAEDWPRFRGPNADGISTETGWKAKGEAPIAWSAQVGLGYSAATVADGKVFITGHNGIGSDQIFCFDEETGKQKWVFKYPQVVGALYFQGGTTATVTFEEGRLYQVAREGEVFCLNADTGEEIWKIHLQEDHEYTQPTWGFSGAPLLHEDVLFLNAGEAGLALNKSDGKVVWKSDNDEAGYATPYLFEKEEKKMLILTNKRFYNCVDASNGDLIWEVKWMTRYGVNAADPIVTDEHVFISSGYGKGASLLKWDGTGEPETVWRSREMKNQMNASILVDGHLYGIDGNEGQDRTGLKCMEMLTGKTLWLEESIGHGAVTIADGKLIAISEQGSLEIAPVSTKGYKPFFKQTVVKPKVWTVPVLANGRIYCRNASGDLVAVDVREK